VTLPPLIRDLIVGTMASRRKLEVIAWIDTREGMEERLRMTAPELVLLGLKHMESDEIGLELAQAVPRARIIAFSSGGRNAFVYRAHARRDSLIDFSTEMLIDAIRDI